MLPKSKKPRLMAHPSRAGKGRKNKSAVKHSQLVAEPANTGYGPLTPHDASTLSIQLPANNSTASSVQGSISQTSMQSSVNKRKRVESLGSSANATFLAASTSAQTQGHISQSSILPTAGRNENMALPNPQDGLPSSHSPQVPSLSGPQPIAFFEGAQNFQMRDINVFNDMGTRQNILEIRT
ncbi:hypothetical protein H1R20_g10645, partial [Candolleomyces eurysporus]